MNSFGVLENDSWALEIQNADNKQVVITEGNTEMVRGVAADNSGLVGACAEVCVGVCGVFVDICVAKPWRKT